MRNDDPYLFDDVDVLKNRLNLKDGDLLEQYEADTVTGRMLVLRKEGFKIESVFDIQKIHKFLFGHIFEWAGEFRRIDMFKKEKILNGFSVNYSMCQFIEDDLTQLDKKFKVIDWEYMDDLLKISFIADIIQELWQIHAFREGNTRTTVLFLYFLIKQVGLHINVDFLAKNACYFRNALVLASIGFRSKKEYLLGIINDTVSVEEPNSNKYKTIEGFDCDKYDARPHTIEKLKTIESLDDITD